MSCPQAVFDTCAGRSWLTSSLLVVIVAISSGVLGCHSSAHKQPDGRDEATQQAAAELDGAVASASDASDEEGPQADAEPCDHEGLVALYVRKFIKERHSLFRGRVDNSAELRSHGCQTMRERLRQWYADKSRRFCERYDLAPIDNVNAIVDRQVQGARYMFAELSKNFRGDYTLRPDTPCQATESYCEQTDDCQRNGACTTGEVEHPAWGRVDECVADEPGCAESMLCAEQGRCGIADGECVAVNEVDCSDSQRCAEIGACSTVDGACAPASDDDCELADACTEYGACVLDPEVGLCIVSRHADCEASRQCAEEGRCVAEVAGRDYPAAGSECTVRFDADCRASKACQEDGRCKVSRALGKCVAESEVEGGPLVDGAGRPLSHGCEELQRPEIRSSCFTDDDGHRRCGEDYLVCHATEAYCAGRRCTDEGFCGPVPATLGKMGCSSQARNTGACTATVDVCGPTDQSCARSTTCSQDGNCRAQIIYPRFYHETYFRTGDRACAPGKDEHCQASAACKEEGKCGHIDGDEPNFDRCAPTDPEHCRQSTICEEEGKCELYQHNIGAECVAG
jgi:hypothetical protein